VHDRGLLAAHPQFLPNPAIHPEYGTAAVAPVQKQGRPVPNRRPGGGSGQAECLNELELRNRNAGGRDEMDGRPEGRDCGMQSSQSFCPRT
jgi:hypothetical protein